MTRRTIGFIVTLILTLLMVSRAPAAQPSARASRIGFLGPSASGDDPRTENFRQFGESLRDLGYVEGQNLTIEWRLAENYTLYPTLAAELVGLNVDVIVTPNTPEALALKQATATIPVVMVAIGDPVGTGLVASLARPGGNITGFSWFSPDLAGKRLELLKELASEAGRVAVLFNQDNPVNWRALSEAQEAAHALGITLHPLGIRGPDDVARVFAKMTRERPDARTAIMDALVLNHRKPIVDFVAKHRLPAIYETREFVDVGGLMSYGPSRNHQFRRAATFVDKILKGAKPTELPVEQPTKFELVINLKTAQVLGLTIPRASCSRPTR
jgi:putative ABC transport system substrate-binding protein